MNKGFYVSVLALALATVACNGKKEGALSGGIDVANLDKTVSPKTDFYQYACGGWMKTHPLTDEYGRFGSFDLLAENNRTQLHGLIKGLATQQQEPGSIGQKIGDLYNLAMDSTKLNADGMKPMKPMLDKVAAVKDRKGLTVLAAEMTRQGLGAYFNLFIGADEKNSSMNIVQAFQGGLGLGDRDYYLSDDAHNKDIRAKYEAHIARMFRLAGYEEGQAVKAAGQAMAVETDLLERQAPGIDWNLYFKSLGVPEVKELNVAQPEALAEVAKQVGKGDLDAQKSYLLWKVIDGAASYLSDEFVEANFDFYGKVLSGTPEMQPRWKRAVSAVDGMMGEAVGKMYVEKYFPAAAKERMVKLVGNLQQALGERIRALTWMSDETKAKALEKLSAIYVKVGYPDQWRDYSSLDIKKDSYWANVLRSNVFEYDYMLAKNGKPVDKTEWMMTPQTVNAYYNPTTNEICFPAGILQYPFFDMKADDAFNYGAIGVVIGHEMTHGFDNHGRQYDKDGNLRDWWTAEDAKKFEERTQVLVDWFDKIEVLPGLHANGKLTLGENIADYGGLQVAFQAFHNAVKDAPLGVVDGFTPEQRFYLAYAGVWAANIRDEEIRLRTQTDEHSLGRWRVNATLPHIEGWYEAFGVQEGDPMYLAPDKRASIW